MNHQRSFDTRDVEKSSAVQYVERCLEKVYRRKTVLFVCLAAFAIDPLFLFIPVIDSHRFCFTFDKKLGVTACVFRTLIDAFYVIHVFFRFITELVPPSPQVSLRDELIVPTSLVVDILSVLPIPQVVVLTFFQRKQQSASLVSKKILKWMIICQYIPRIIRIYPLLKQVTKASGTVVETKWIGAALNLFLYMLPSYVIGAFWYLNAIERENKCWYDACAMTSGCKLMNLYCARGGGENSRFLNTSCPLIDPEQITNSTVFNFGMYIDALKSGVVESRYFPRKFFYCFWWGLRNHSALGQNLKTSNSVEEIFFAITICVNGLLLFAVLIGNVQKYLQSTTIKVDEKEERKRDTEKWMLKRAIPEALQTRIREYEDYKWREFKGTEEDAILLSLPKDLRLQARCHLYLDLLKSVHLLQIMNDWLLEAVCDRVKSVFYSKNSYIVKEGDPVEEVLIVTKGKLKSTTRSRGDKIWSYQGEGDVCGEVLFDGFPYPTHTRTVMTHTEVEGFILLPDDVKFVASHLTRLQRLELKQMLSCLSLQRRLWSAAFVIQAAWRLKRKCSKILRAQRETQNIPQGTQLNLGATIYVSRFFSKALRNLRKNTAECSSSPYMLLPVSQKPD